MKPSGWLVVALAAVALLTVANVLENATQRRRVRLAVQDSAARVHGQALDSAVAVFQADSLRTALRLDSLRRRAARVRVVTVARTDTLREALPDSLRPALDSIVAGYETQLAVADSALRLTTGRLQAATVLLVDAQALAREWETQATRWRREATRWTLKLGPFQLRPVVGYGLTPVGAQAFAGIGLSP